MLGALAQVEVHSERVLHSYPMFNRNQRERANGRGWTTSIDGGQFQMRKSQIPFWQIFWQTFFVVAVALPLTRMVIFPRISPYLPHSRLLDALIQVGIYTVLAVAFGLLCGLVADSIRRIRG
jgi:hypothetical protein